MKRGSGKKWVFLTASQEKFWNSQGILIHVLGMNPVAVFGLGGLIILQGRLPKKGARGQNLSTEGLKV